MTTGASSSDRRDLWFLNTRVLIRVSYQDGGDDISVLEHWAGFRDGPPLHVHQSEDEVFQVLAGEVRFRVGDREQEQRARAGDILLVPQGTGAEGQGWRHSAGATRHATHLPGRVT